MFFLLNSGLQTLLYSIIGKTDVVNICPGLNSSCSYRRTVPNLVAFYNDKEVKIVELPLINFFSYCFVFGLKHYFGYFPGPATILLHCIMYNQEVLTDFK